MEALVFPGGYRDDAGYEAITWRVEGSRRYKLPRLDFFTTVRGIDLWGTDFDGLEPARSLCPSASLNDGRRVEVGGHLRGAVGHRHEHGVAAIGAPDHHGREDGHEQAAVA
jgi:hypothetical protein